MGFLFAGVLAALTNPVWLALGTITGFLLGRRQINLGWSTFVIVWLGYMAFGYIRPKSGLSGGIYAYVIIVGVAFLLTRLLSEPTEADGE